jgi:photosystem II stability/assembly factor-like uncharacterized protein
MSRSLAVLVALSVFVITLPGPTSAAKSSSGGKAKAAASKPSSAESKKSDPDSLFKSGTFSGLAFRSLGPAVTSGRVSDLAVDPTHPDTWFVTAASGGVWKTDNAGITWTPVFDTQGSYSIGCVTIDPRDPLTVWVGTGENNSQRSVSYGDGVYRSTDGGKSWTNVGLKDSEHIGKIVVDPRNSNVVYVASQGPLWRAGGDRGLYKTTDGGKTWNRILNVDEWTGINEVALDPRDPEVLYATAYQRARQVWALIDGGPGSAIWKSRDGGATWKKLEDGLPKGDKGRIGIAISPVHPDVVYAIVEARGKEQGFYRSTDAGGSWEKMSDYMSTSPQYYNRIFADPEVEGRVYAMDTWMMVTDDAGKTFRRAGEKSKHVDNHVLWIDPSNTKHLIDGCDGGLYQSFDRAKNWEFFANLPITQFYNVAVDEDAPFYHVYGGTQDNNTLGGPSQTNNSHGIRNSDWYVTAGGDGFQCAVDPTDPNIVYSESQYGGLVRYDRKTGEQVDIQPQSNPGEPPLRWNWDSPILVSPHSHTRLYFAAQRVFQSDDRGDTWKPVSPDLTRQIDRNKLKMMGRVWSVDAVAKNASTSAYGNIVSLEESPKQEGLVYVGTDDGLIQVGEGGSWHKVESFPGVPANTYVSDLAASRHEAGRIYASFDGHSAGDFKPYLLRSDDKGKSWTSIAGNLPARGSVYAIAEDHVDPNLLFAGTEFGVFFTNDGGKRWTQLKGGLPTISVKDIAIQRRENDLVLATFGRGFYVLDDYSCLRGLKTKDLEQGPRLVQASAGSLYVPANPMGLREKGFQGEAFYTAPNPPFGATFTYYLRRDVRTLKKTREEHEREIEKKGGDVYYPAWDSLRAEDREEEPTALLIVSDEEGHVVKRVPGPLTAGFHRVSWDLRYPASNPARERGEAAEEENPFADRITGPMVVPGAYTVQLATRVRDKLQMIGDPVKFQCAPMGEPAIPVADRAATLEFERKTARLQRAVLGAVEAAREAQTEIDALQKALDQTPAADPAMMGQARALEHRLADLRQQLSGDATLRKHEEPVPPSIVDDVQNAVAGQWFQTHGPTATHQKSYENAATRFAPVLEQLRTLVDTDLAALQKQAEAAGAPWTPGRVPEWKP